jgi:hypothetical protein
LENLKNKNEKISHLPHQEMKKPVWGILFGKIHSIPSSSPHHPPITDHFSSPSKY